MKFFDINGPFMAILTRAVNYIFLYVLSAVCSLPLVTAGASTTARYYVAMKLVRGEEPSVWKSFFKSFKENFKQSTIIWLIELAVATILFFDWYYILQMELTQIGRIIKIALLVLTVFCFLAGLAAFPLIARYQMSVKEIIKASFVFVFLHPIRMVIVFFWMVVPIYLIFRYPSWAVGIWPIVPAMATFFNAKMFMKQFGKIEEKREQLTATQPSDDEPAADTGNADAKTKAEAENDTPEAEEGASQKGDDSVE